MSTTKSPRASASALLEASAMLPLAGRKTGRMRGSRAAARSSTQRTCGAVADILEECADRRRELPGAAHQRAGERSHQAHAHLEPGQLLHPQASEPEPSRPVERVEAQRANDRPQVDDRPNDAVLRARQA